MRSTVLLLTLSCLVLGACGTASKRTAKTAAPAEPVAKSTTETPAPTPIDDPVAAEPIAIEPTPAAPVQPAPVTVEPAMAATEPVPAAPIAAAPAPIKPQPAPVVQAKPAPAPAVEPPKPTRSRREAAVESTPTATPHAPVPELPAVVDRATTGEQLAAHALVVAREEVAAGTTNGYGVLDRQAHLLATWTPAMQARQAELAAIAQAREARSQQQVSAAERLAANDARLSKMEAEYERKAAAEQAKTAPILPQ